MAQVALHYHEMLVHVCRCRYLEETGCASVCINSCKLPTQRFFAEDMGLPLTMVSLGQHSVFP